MLLKPSAKPKAAKKPAAATAAVAISVEPASEYEPVYCFAAEISRDVTAEMVRSMMQCGIKMHKVTAPCPGDHDIIYAYIELGNAPRAPIQVLKMDPDMMQNVVGAEQAFRWLQAGQTIKSGRKAPGETPSGGFMMVRNVPEQPPVPTTAAVVAPLPSKPNKKAAAAPAGSLMHTYTKWNASELAADDSDEGDIVDEDEE